MTTKPLYELTPEHEAQLPAWRDKWIANALNTRPLTTEDKERMVEACYGMYAAANLKKPRVLFCASPLSGNIAAGLAAGLLWCDKNEMEAKKLFKKTTRFERFAVANQVAMLVCAKGSKELVGREVNSTSMYVEVARALRVASGYGPDEFKDAEGLPSDFSNDNLVQFFRHCVRNAADMLNGGNQWSGWVAYLSFFRHIAKLDIDYSKWQHYETAAEAGPRFMHEDFCIVSELPVRLTVDEQNRPHHPTQAYCAWADGWELGYWHGTAVPVSWLTDTANADPRLVLDTSLNVEQRRALAEIIGWGKVLDMLDAKVIDQDKDPEIGTLLEVDLPDAPNSRFLKVQCGTKREFVLSVPREAKTALEAQCLGWGVTEYAPEVRT